MVKLKSSSNRLFAMIVREKFCKQQHLTAGVDAEKFSYQPRHRLERNIGLLGRKCRFIAETIATFDSRV